MTEWWTIWCENPVTVCSKHKSLLAAIRAAKKCEKDDRAAPHTIVKVEFVRGWRKAGERYAWLGTDREVVK